MTKKITNERLEMAASLDAMLEAWDKDDGGRDEDLARSIAKDYVLENEDKFTQFEGKTVDELVQMIDKSREAESVFEGTGMDNYLEDVRVHRLLIDTFLLASVPKRHIGGENGELNAKVMIPNG